MSLHLELHKLLHCHFGVGNKGRYIRGNGYQAHLWGYNYQAHIEVVIESNFISCWQCLPPPTSPTSWLVVERHVEFGVSCEYVASNWKG